MPGARFDATPAQAHQQLVAGDPDHPRSRRLPLGRVLAGREQHGGEDLGGQVGGGLGVARLPHQVREHGWDVAPVEHREGRPVPRRDR